MPNGTLEDQIHNGPIIDIITSCKECDSKHLARDYERGELVCEDCGLVLEDCAIDRGREWVGGGKNDARKGSRGVGPINNITKVNNLSTLVGYVRDGHRRYIPAYKEPMMKRLRTLQKIEGIKAAGNVNLGRAMRELGRQISYLELPPAIKNQSAYLYKHAVSKKIIRGRTIEVMVGASIYAACIQQNIPRTLQEMAGASKKRKKRCCRSISNSEKRPIAKPSSD